MTIFADPEHDDYEQRVILASGSAAQPSLTFSGDETKGFWFDGTDIQSIGVAGGGVTYPLLAPNGTNAAPSYSFSDKTSTGLVLSGSDPLISLDIVVNNLTVASFQTYNTDRLLTLGPGTYISLDTFQLGTDSAASVITGLYGDISFTTLSVAVNGEDSARFDNSSTAGDTRMLLWDVDSGALVRVSVGVADSGGVGYKVLRIPN